MIKKAIVDSGIFIGAKHKSDQYHSKSTSIINAFAQGKINEIYITDYVLLETVNFLLRKTNYNTALEAFNFLNNTDRIKITFIDNFKLTGIKKLFEEFDDLSVTDCSLILFAQSLNIKHIFSFDSSFDKVKGIERLEEFPGNV